MLPSLLTLIKLIDRQKVWKDLRNFIFVKLKHVFVSNIYKIPHFLDICLTSPWTGVCVCDRQVSQGSRWRCRASFLETHTFVSLVLNIFTDTKMCAHTDNAYLCEEIDTNLLMNLENYHICMYTYRDVRISMFLQSPSQYLVHDFCVPSMGQAHRTQMHRVEELISH